MSQASELSDTEYGHIVRIAGKDVDGSRKLVVALSEIKGIGFNFAQVLLNTLQVDPDIRVGFLSESEISVIENGVRNPEKIGIPQWFLNRRRDMQTGTTTHIITTDWDVTVDNDIEREKRALSWRGFRHMMGLKVRGQKTRTTGRKGGAVGVRKIGRATPTAAPSGATDAAAPAGKESTTAKGDAVPATGDKQPAVPAKEAQKTKEGSKPAQDKGGK